MWKCFLEKYGNHKEFNVKSVIAQRRPTTSALKQNSVPSSGIGEDAGNQYASTTARLRYQRKLVLRDKKLTKGTTAQMKSALKSTIRPSAMRDWRFSHVY